MKSHKRGEIMKRLISKDKIVIDNYDMAIYDKLNQLFHNNIPKTYLLNYVTDRMLAKQIKLQELGKKRITDKSFKDIVRRYVTKYRTLDDIDFYNIFKENNLCENLLNDFISKFGMVDNVLNCSEEDLIRYIQSFQPKIFDIEEDLRN